MQDLERHKRVNDIFLGSLERPALRWLAGHLPAWVKPDVLTIIGALGAVIIFTSYYLTRFDKNFLWLASLGFAINWFGDSLDGTLARYRGIQRPNYGYFIDHTVDAMSEVLVFVGLGLSPYVSFDIASLALIGYLLMEILVSVRNSVKGEFKISYAKIGPTEMRLIAISINTMVYFYGNPIIHFGPFGLTVFEVCVLAIAILLMTTYLISMVRQARLLAHID